MNSEEKRIYVVVAKVVDTIIESKYGVIAQIPGRMAAQGGHALSRMRMHRMAELMKGKKYPPQRLELEIEELEEGYEIEELNLADEKITTIWLACRDGKELDHVAGLLDIRRIDYYDFQDENDSLYGLEFHPRTALATFPVFPADVIGILDYLPLWKPEEM
jgi:hypothetical protein